MQLLLLNIIFIASELDAWSRDSNSGFNLTDSLFWGVNLARNADPDEYVYNGYGTGFDSGSEFSLPDGSVGKTFIIFGVDMSSSVHIDSNKKYILILGIGPTQGLNDTTLTAKV